MDSSQSPMGGSGGMNQSSGGTPAPSGDNTNMLMGILAYLGPLVIVSYITAKDKPFVKFHIKQGLVLLVIEVAVWIVGMMMWQLWMILNLINVAALVFTVLGIVNVVQGKEKELPLIGGFSKYFPI